MLPTRLRSRKWPSTIWLDRITYFERTDRRSEVGQLHRAMVNVFAPGDNAFETPLDVRLHRRLGDIYLFAKRSQEAAKQYDLALRLSPRDIFLLHKKGLALLESGDEPGAKQMLDRLLEIDPSATRWSTEIAGMKGRLFWQKYNKRERSPTSGRLVMPTPTGWISTSIPTTWPTT